MQRLIRHHDYQITCRRGTVKTFELQLSLNVSQLL